MDRPVSVPAASVPANAAALSALARAEMGGGRSLRALAWRQFRRNRGAVAGLVVMLVLIAVALGAPFVAPYDPLAPSELRLEPPQPGLWMGTDVFGRDIFSRVIWGARLSLAVGIISVAIGATLGTLFGLLSGYYRGLTDSAISMGMDVLLAFPGILLALSIIAVLGPNLQNVMIAVGLSAVPVYTRLVRGSVLSVRENQFVEAARVIGCSGGRIMLRHILPNITAPVIVLSTLSIAAAILTAAGLSFLGLGVRPPTPEWGSMVSDGRQYLRTAWWISTGPGLVIMLTVLAINQVGDGLRDALDPRLRV